jgi:hypothetical protein
MTFLMAVDLRIELSRRGPIKDDISANLVIIAEMLYLELLLSYKKYVSQAFLKLFQYVYIARGMYLFNLQVNKFKQPSL